MLELKIQCETPDEARMYLNAPQYHNLISDFRHALRNAQKHGTDAEVLKVVQDFFPELCISADNHLGAY